MLRKNLPLILIWVFSERYPREIGLHFNCVDKYPSGNYLLKQRIKCQF